MTNKTSNINIRVTLEEKELLQILARKYPLSSVIRNLALDAAKQLAKGGDHE
jgi:hypothetical protein